MRIVIIGAAAIVAVVAVVIALVIVSTDDDSTVVATAPTPYLDDSGNIQWPVGSLLVDCSSEDGPTGTTPLEHYQRCLRTYCELKPWTRTDENWASPAACAE